MSAGPTIVVTGANARLGRQLSLELARRGAHVVMACRNLERGETDGAKRHAVAHPESAIRKWLNKKVESWIPTVAEAAEPILHAACSGDVRGGDYYGPGGWLEIAGAPARARVNRRAFDAELASQLWSTSESLTGVRYLSETPGRSPC